MADPHRPDSGGQRTLQLLPSGEDAVGMVVGRPSGESSSCGGGDNSKKSAVRFSPVIRVKYVPHLADISDDVFDAVYNSPQDLKRIEAGVVGSIRSYRSGRLSLDGAGPEALSEEDTIRGLEHVVSASELRRRKDFKERAVEAVLGEQSRRRMAAAADPAASEEGNEALARAYARAAAPARNLALENGRKDALFVRLRVRAATPKPQPLPRPILKKENSVSKSVLARLGAIGELQPQQQQQQKERSSMSENDLKAILGLALDVNSAPPAPQAQRARSPTQLGGQQVLALDQSQRVCTSRDSSLWASLSREAAVAFPASVEAQQRPPPGSGSGSGPPGSGSGSPGSGSGPPKLARDVLERISLTLQAEKVDPTAPLPVAVPLPMPSPPSRGRSGSESLMEMLTRTSIG